MAEIISLLASIAGVTMAGIHIAKLLRSSVLFVMALEPEIIDVVRQVETLSSVFEEISTTLQLRSEGLSSSTKINFSRRAIVTIANLVQDSQSLYEKTAHAASHRNKFVGVKPISLTVPWS